MAVGIRLGRWLGILPPLVYYTFFALLASCSTYAVTSLAFGTNPQRVFVLAAVWVPYLVGIYVSCAHEVWLWNGGVCRNTCRPWEAADTDTPTVYRSVSEDGTEYFYKNQYVIHNW